MPAVVSDSSPLVYLTRLGCLTWLRDFYGEVLIPPAVWREIVETGAGLPEAMATTRASEAGWLRVQAPATCLALSAPGEQLDPGELEAISLAAELGAMLIIDEQVGRRIALRLGLKVTGVIGLLLEAKGRGLIPSLRSALDRLRDGTNFRLSEEVRATALRLAAEDDLRT
jgi:predicted nucleic acid-binding protein